MAFIEQIQRWAASHGRVWRIGTVLFILLVMCSFAIPVSQSAPVFALSAYGAGAYSGSNPIGGGAGYYDIKTTGTYTATTASQISSYLSTASSGQTVYVQPGTYTMSGTLTVKAGVTLASNRGSGGSDGALLYWPSIGGETFALKIYANSRVTGIQLKGSLTTDWTSSSGGNGVQCLGNNAKVDNCLITRFGRTAGVWVSSDTAYIEFCTITHCSFHGMGYGVGIGAFNCTAMITGNYIDYCRHAVSGQRSASGCTVTSRYSNYTAMYNIIGSHTINHLFDVHGGADGPSMGWDCGPKQSCAAGALTIIRYNTVQATTKMDSGSGTYAVRIRGIPHTHCYVEHNWFYVSTQSAAVQQDLDGWGLSEYQKMTVDDNWYGTSSPPSTPTPPTGYPPVASFTGSPMSGTDPLTVTFKDKSANTPTTWSWNFGDGSTSAVQNPTHTYTTAGTYDVTLTVTNAYGSNSVTDEDYITVSASAPTVVEANFSASPTSGDSPLTVNFTDTSTGTPTVWQWDFGDSSGMSALQNPSHIYTEPGIYTVTLTASNAISSDIEIKIEYVTVTVTTGGIEIGTTTLGSLSYPYQRRLFFGNGRFWMFYSDGSNLVYKSSVTGNYWGTSTIVLTGVTASSRVTTHFDGTYLHIAYAPGASGSALQYRRYECVGDGTITPSAAWQTVKAGAAGVTYYNTSICIDGSGHPIIAYLHYIDALGTSTPYVNRSDQTNGTWTSSTYDYQLNATAVTQWRVAIVATASDNLMAIYGRDGQTIKSRVWSGSWLAENTTTSALEVGSQFSAVVTSDNVTHLVFNKDVNEDIIYTHYHIGGIAWEAEEVLYTGTNALLAPILEKDNLDYLYCFWLEDPDSDHIYYLRQISGVWEVAPTDWMESTSIISASSVTGGYQQAPGNYLSLAWLAGSSSPYSIRFAYLEGATPSFYVDEHALSLDSSEECWDSALITAAVNSDNISAGVRWVTDEGIVWDTVAHDNPGNMIPSGTGYANNWQGSATYTDNFDIVRYITGLAQGSICYVRFGVQWSDSGYWIYSDEIAFEVDDIGGTLMESITTPSENISEAISSVHWSFESIVATSDHTVNFVRVLAYRTGAPTTIHISLYDEDPVTFTPTGTALATGDADVSDITTDNCGEWVVVGFDVDVSLTMGNSYDLVVSQESGAGNIYWVCSNSAGLGYYAHSDDAGTTWTYDPGPGVRDALYQLWDCDGTGDSSLHIIDADYESISLGWQVSEGLSYVLVYKTSGYPSSVTDGTLVYSGEITSAMAENLTSGRTYYFSLWSYLTMPCSDETFFTTTPATIAATTTAGIPHPPWDGEPTEYDVNPSILQNGGLGDLIEFLGHYGELPVGTINTLGYSSILMFMLVALASYNRSVSATLAFSVIGLLLGNALGVYATISLVIAVVGGVTVGILRGGQPT